MTACSFLRALDDSGMTVIHSYLIIYIIVKCAQHQTWSSYTHSSHLDITRIEVSNKWMPCNDESKPGYQCKEHTIIPFTVQLNWHFESFTYYINYNDLTHQPSKAILHHHTNITAQLQELYVDHSQYPNDLDNILDVYVGVDCFRVDVSSRYSHIVQFQAVLTSFLCAVILRWVYHYGIWRRFTGRG